MRVDELICRKRNESSGSSPRAHNLLNEC